MCIDTISLGLEPAIPLVPVTQHFLCTSQHRSEAIDACKILAEDPQWIVKHTLARFCFKDGISSAHLCAWVQRSLDVSSLLHCAPVRRLPLPVISLGDVNSEFVAGVARLLRGRREICLMPHCCLTRHTFRRWLTSTTSYSLNFIGSRLFTSHEWGEIRRSLSRVGKEP